MARGIQVTYITDPSQLTSISNPVELDLAVIKSEQSIDTTVPNDRLKSTKVYQLQNGSWTDVTDQNIDWTDGAILENVTEIRRAHLEDIRNRLDYASKCLAKRHGDAYFNIHDFTKANLFWEWTSPTVATKFAEMSLRDYDFTVRFGRSGTVANGALPERIKYVYRETDGTEKDILSIASNFFTVYTDAGFEGNVSFNTLDVTTVLTVGDQIKSTVTNKPPMQAASTLKVANLNVDAVDDCHVDDAATDNKSIFTAKRVLELVNTSIPIASDVVLGGIKVPSNSGIKVDDTGRVSAQMPVGSLYFNALQGQNPSDLLGYGTWEAFAEGRVLLGVGTADYDNTKTFDNGVTGGEAEHTLTVEELPAHHHTYNMTARVGGLSLGDAGSGGSPITAVATNSGDTGGGQAHSNMQPYIPVYIWVRVA